MPLRSKQETALSIRRAFVVHFAASPGDAGDVGREVAPRRRRFRGRVEHLSSGESAHFSSLEGLLAFVGRTLQAEDRVRVSGQR